jgi:hypothetical protein
MDMAVRSMRKQFYRNPECVEAIIGAVVSSTADEDDEDKDKVAKALAWLAEGVEVDSIYRSFCNRGINRGYEILLAASQGNDLAYRSALNRGIDPSTILLVALQGGDFTTVPRIDDPVRSVKPRRVESGSFGVNLFTDSGIVAGDRVLLRLLPPAEDPKSALRNFLTTNPRATRPAALNALHTQFPDLSGREFDRLWPQAREDARLPSRGRAGRPRENGRHDKK